MGPSRTVGHEAPKASFEQWRLLALLVVCVLVNYLDRGNLAVAAADITRELRFTPAQMGLLASAFFWTYSLCQIVAGWVLDRYDVYRVLALGFFLMSLATALTSTVGNFGELLALRLLVGLGASVAFPSFSKILAANFRESQRGKANAFIDAGTKIAPAIIMFFGGLTVASLGWRALFVILGIGSVAWIPFFWRCRLRGETSAQAVKLPSPSTLRILRERSVWGTFIGLYCLNSAWYFLITWFPYYLVHERQFSTSRMAVLGSLPFWTLATTTSLSGWLSDRWIERGATPTRVRKTFLVTGMVLCTLLLPAALIRDEFASIALFAIACAAFGLTTSNHWATTQCMAGPAAAGKWTGMQNAFGNFAGITTPWIAGVIVDRTHSFYLAFVLIAVMALTGACSYAFLVGRLEPIDWSERR